MRITILTDIHEDYVNLKRAIDIITKLNTDHVVCLGDIVGYETGHYNYDDTRSAKKCVDLVKNNTSITVTGNHDLIAAKRLPYFYEKIGFPVNWYDISMDDKYRYLDQDFFIYKNEAENDLTNESIEYLKSIDYWKVLETNSLNILFSHFIYPDINGNLKTFINRKSGFKEHFAWMSKLNTMLSFAGHAHIRGIGFVTKKGLKIHKFGVYSLKNEPQIILCPTISRNKNESGLVLLDTDEMSLQVISL